MSDARSQADVLRLAEVDFDSPIAQALVAELHGELAALIDGFAPGGGSSVAPEDFVPPAGRFLVAVAGEAPLGCGGLRRLSPAVGEIKRLFVGPSARNRGIAALLLRGLEERARGASYGALRLDTHGREPAAVALFRSAGYQPIADYNGNPYARHWFENDLA